MSNTKEPRKNENQIYKIKITKSIENAMNNVIEEKCEVNKSISKSKSINDLNSLRKVLENSFREKKSMKNSSIENSICQSKKSSIIDKKFNESNIFYIRKINPIQKYRNNINNNNFAFNLIRFTNQLYEKEEHFQKKSIVSSKNDKKKKNIIKKTKTMNEIKGANSLKFLRGNNKYKRLKSSNFSQKFKNISNNNQKWTNKNIENNTIKNENNNDATKRLDNLEDKNDINNNIQINGFPIHKNKKEKNKKENTKKSIFCFVKCSFLCCINNCNV
jgi:hypothetical protein